MGGIRAEVKIQSPPDCPVVSVSAAADASGKSVTRADDDGQTVTEEFVLDGELPADLGTDSEGEPDIREVFSYGSRQVLRFDRDQTAPCPCEAIEQFDCPLLDVYAHNNNLVLVFHVPSIDRLQEILAELQHNWSDVSVHRLIRSGDDRSGDELVLIDRSRLTERQSEVLETAHEMGYFEHSNGANATEVAEEMGITPATFSEHLAAAQQKLLTSVVDA